MPAVATASKTSIADAVRQRILKGDLVPGQWLVEADLCHLLNASRGNVRGALLDLTHEGLVERIANRGARVREVKRAEALQIAEVRLAVETLCVAKAAENITRPEVQELRTLAKKLKKFAEADDIVAFADTSHEVFHTYVRIANQPVAAEVLERLRSRILRHPFRLTYRQGRAREALPYWLDLIEAICKGDAKAAQRAAKRHSENVQAAMKHLQPEEPIHLDY